MPRITYEAYAFWSNYHMTISFPARPKALPPGVPAPPRDPPMVGIQQLGRVFAADLDGLPPLMRFARLGEVLQKHISDTAALVPETPDPAAPAGASFAAGMVGRGWSFAPLIGSSVSQLLCDGIAHIGFLADIDKDSGLARVPIAVVGGGTRLRELATWAAPHGLTIATSGTHLGPTLAGAVATGSHGSKIGYGGIQNMVIGMHLITGPAEHVWLERASRPVLNESGLQQLQLQGTLPTPLRDDGLFDAALVHLGGMGIVNGLAVELVQDIAYGWFRRDKAISNADLELIDHGAFQALAAGLGVDAVPAFYELTIDPRQPTGPSALHTMFFPLGSTADLVTADAEILGASEAIVRFGQHLTLQFANDRPTGWSFVEETLLAGKDDLGTAPNPEDAILRQIMGGNDSAFEFYTDTGGFDKGSAPHRPVDLPHARWAGLHARDEITGGVPGALYNASFAIPRDQVSRAIPAICAAVEDLSPTFIFTLRFVSSAAGTLAFTRFAETAVIEIDGLSPFIFDHLAAGLDPVDPTSPIVRQALWRLGGVLPEGARCVRAALDSVGVPFSMHWAKLGDLDAAKVHADYGDPVTQPKSVLGHWVAARDFLLSPLARTLFWNKALVRYGIVR